jgi:hypothetical protein
MLSASRAILGTSCVDGGVAVRHAMLRLRQSQDAAAFPALVLAAIALVLSLAFALTACTPASSKTAADIAGIACKLVPVFDTSSTGELVGAFCADVAKLVSDALAEQSVAPKTAAASCGSLVEIRSDGRLVGFVCPAYASLASRTVAP